MVADREGLQKANSHFWYTSYVPDTLLRALTNVPLNSSHWSIHIFLLWMMREMKGLIHQVNGRSRIQTYGSLTLKLIFLPLSSSNWDVRREREKSHFSIKHRFFTFWSLVSSSELYLCYTSPYPCPVTLFEHSYSHSFGHVLLAWNVHVYSSPPARFFFN